MSEFSESYHLRSEHVEDAMDILRVAKRKGFVYQPANGWVTFLAEEGVFEPDERIVAAAKHPLLHYVSAEDHGWSFTLFDRTQVVCAYRCDWENDITVDDSRYSRDAIERLVTMTQKDLVAAFEERLQPKDFDELFEAEPSKLFAQAIGLEHYDWLAYDYLAGDFHASPGNYPGVTELT